LFSDIYIVFIYIFIAWRDAAAQDLMHRRMHKALDEDMHTPLTLAAASKKTGMMEAIIEQLIESRLEYGPVNRSLVDLQGFEIALKPRQVHNNKNIVDMLYIT